MTARHLPASRPSACLGRLSKDHHRRSRGTSANRPSLPLPAAASGRIARMAGFGARPNRKDRPFAVILNRDPSPRLHAVCGHRSATAYRTLRGQSQRLHSNLDWPSRSVSLGYSKSPAAVGIFLFGGHVYASPSQASAGEPALKRRADWNVYTDCPLRLRGSSNGISRFRAIDRTTQDVRVNRFIPQEGREIPPPIATLRSRPGFARSAMRDTLGPVRRRDRRQRAAFAFAKSAPCRKSISFCTGPT